jgi:hypothetical protein
MKAIVELNLNTPQATLLLGYLESLPYAKVRKEQPNDMDALLKAAGPGAITLDEAGVKFEEAIQRAYNL